MSNININFIEGLLKESGKTILKEQSESRIIEKSDLKGFVTNVDANIGRLIFSKINKYFPKDSIECEDGIQNKQGSSNRVWYVDPLDGTTNFIHGLPFFAVCISCYDKQKSEFVVSGVYIPFFDQLFMAFGQDLVKLNGMKITVSKTKVLKDSLILSGFSYKLEQNGYEATTFIKISSVSNGTRRSGSAAFDLCYVAAGFADAYYHFNLKPWDIAAGCHIVKNAGGYISNINTAGTFNLYNKTVIASNNLIHRELSIQLLENNSI